ncbi:MAG: hypothetical protein MSC30_08670 [Gaiellaceae bacterium MAG52_C11]|nr:hypothetical protein [Candidatus Gaiellasilicea maunaloa]
MIHTQRRRARLLVVLGVILAAALAAAPSGVAAAKKPIITTAVAFDVSPPVTLLQPRTGAVEAPLGNTRSGNAPVADGDSGYTGDIALQSSGFGLTQASGPLANFEGLSNQDNFNIFGFRVNPPDPVGDIGPHHYVEMVNLVFGVYDKAGNPLLAPVDTGTLWAGFAIEDCTDPSGDPIVLYDQTTDRWILTQFTTRGLDPATPTAPFYNCVAISTSGDPTGSYYRYAFITQQDPDGGYYFPDYPKYGVWTNSYLLTTRDFGTVDGYGISVYALEKHRLVNGDANARAIQFFLDSEDPDVALEDLGDGLLPADIDGDRRPHGRAPAPIVGTQDDGAGYGATVDALNIYDLTVKWSAHPTASLSEPHELPTAPFDSIFPCAPTARDCLPQPGIVDPAQYLDILSYRQRPTHRLAYRNFGSYETLVTNQSVEALPGVAGVRWYEVRRVDGVYSIYQQGTYAPGDGVHRWMGSAAMDRYGNIALGYSVVNGTNVYPGIRYTGRLAGDPAGQLTVAEGTIVDGSGVQTTLNSRWGDYTSLNVDPVDDCTFWYVNEYYTAAGQASATNGWQTRIASFRLPGCG